MGMPAGAKNAYYCPVCRSYTVTIHVDEGTTPMFLSCRSFGDVNACPGTAQSIMYPDPWPPTVPSKPAYEWYKASLKELEDGHRSLEEREHYQLGGLDLRPVQTPTGQTAE